LENLETRFCPAGSVINPLAITSLSVVNTSGHTVQVTGNVEDAAQSPAMSVILTGAVNATVSVQGTGSHSGIASDGSAVTYFTGSFNLTTTTAVLGELDAVAKDNYKNASDMATATLTSNAPVIQDFAVVHIGNVWTFTGKVIDEAPGGLTVTFSGAAALNNRTTITDANGFFSVTYTLSTPNTWLASAVTTDVWGQPSNEVSYSI